MSHEPPKWYDPNADNPPWIKALADVRHVAAREGYCFQGVRLAFGAERRSRDTRDTTDLPSAE
jgi:hypothetical protein